MKGVRFNRRHPRKANGQFKRKAKSHPCRYTKRARPKSCKRRR
jgi:hypothetical protein